METNDNPSKEVLVEMQISPCIVNVDKKNGRVFLIEGMNLASMIEDGDFIIVYRRIKGTDESVYNN